MAKLNVYNLGTLGLDLVNNPLQVVDGALFNCQNAQPSTNDAEISLRKRDGMVKVNTVAAAGTLVAIFNVPI